MTPKLSIICPVYNTEKYLPKCIESILTQTFNDFELILIDDGSTDNSGKICDEYSQRDYRIIVIHKENGGQSSARNIGLNICKGNYITFVDSDDYYLVNNTIEHAIKILETNKETDIVQFPLIHPERNIIKYDIIVYSKEEQYVLWLNKNIITNYLCDKIFKSKIFEDLTLPEGQIYEDRYIFPTLLNRSIGYQIISYGGYYYRQHSMQTTRKKINSNILINKIKADANILNLMPKNLISTYCIIYYRLLCNYVELNKYNCNCDIPLLNIPTFQIINAKYPIGIKLRLLFLKFFGFNI